MKLLRDSLDDFARSAVVRLAGDVGDPDETVVLFDDRNPAYLVQ